MISKIFAIYTNRGQGFEERWIETPYRAQAANEIEALAGAWLYKPLQCERDLAVLEIKPNQIASSDDPRSTASATATATA